MRTFPYIGPENRIDRSSFGFDTREVTAVSTAGTPYSRRVWCGMPKLSPSMLRSVFYLYRSRQEAVDGKDFGGTGFFLGVELGETRFCYAVTNWHVAVDGGASVIRVNTNDGGMDIFELDPCEWHFKPHWHDLAVVPIPLDPAKHSFSYIDSRMLAIEPYLSHAQIGPGEDIFLIGRFVDHDGGQTNIPAVRFGHISVMPQPIKQPTKAEGLPSYILDVHSRSGYSGSPVFVYRTPGSDLTHPETRNGVHQFVMMLGVHWGQFPEKWEIDTDANVRRQVADLHANPKYVTGMSGMTLAIPAEAILELLNMPKLKQERDKIFEDQRRASGLTPRAELATPTEPDAENPQHREGFTALLNAAVKKPKSGG